MGRAPTRKTTEAILALTTVGSEEQASRIAEALLEDHLAACVNILPSIRSVYRWKGKIWDDEEFLLLIKTTRERFAAVHAAIKKLHSYELPEVLALPVTDGDEAALAWIEQSVSPAAGTAKSSRS